LPTVVVDLEVAEAWDDIVVAGMEGLAGGKVRMSLFSEALVVLAGVTIRKIPVIVFPNA